MSQLFTDDELFGKPSSGGKLFTDEELFGNGSTSKNQNKGAAADIGTDLKRGTLKIPSMVTGLLDIPVAAVTGRPMVSEGWDEIGKLTGFQPGKWAKDAEGDYSQGRKQARQNIDAAWEDGSVLDIAQAYKDNPSQTLGSIAESIPSMLTGSVLGRALMGVGAKAVSTGAGAVGPALPGALARAAGEKWAPSIAAGAGEGSVMAGQAMSDLVEKGVDPRTAAGYAATIGVAGGALGTLGGKVAQRMGVIDPETALTGGVTRAANGIESATAMQAAKEAGKRIVGGGIVEGVFEELPQSLIEQGLSNLAQDKPFTEGLARAGVEGTLAGTAMGGAFNLRPAKKGETEAVPPVSPPAVAPTAPEQPAPAVTANEVAQHAATRLAEIERKATGSEERTIRGPDGAPVVIPGEQPQFLTHEEKAEREFLLNNQADPAALAAGYGVQIKESERDPFERLAEISLISEQRELTPAEAGEYTQLVTQIESGEAYAETEAQPADVSQNVQKINTSGEPVQNTPENEQVTQHTITAPDIKTAVQSAAQQYGPDVVIVGQKNTAAGVSLTVSVPAQAADNPAAPVSNTAIGELQNRDRSRAASVNQMQSIARSPDYMRLGPSRTPDSGAPMVFAVGNDLSAIQPTHMGREDVAVMADGQRVPFRYAVVDANAVNPSNFADGTANPGFSSGEPGALKALNNGRAAGMRAAHGAGNGLAYTAELIADATSHGVPVEAIRSTPNPMLVRVYSEDSNTSDMAAKSQGQGPGMSPAELAQQDAPLIDLSALAVYEPGDIASAGNRDFVRSFVGGLQASGQDIAPLITADGQLSQMGRQRIQAALVQAAYGDADLVQEMFDSTDTDIKAIGEVLKSVAGAWAGMRKAAEIGAINPETDITGNLMQAVRMIQSSRRNKTSIYDMINQRDIMTGETPDALTVSTLRLFYTGQYLTRAAGKERLADSLSRYLTGAIQTQESGGLFGDTVSAQDVLNSITQGDQSESGNQAEESGRESGGRSATRGGADRPGAQAPRPGTNEAGRGIDEAGREAPAQAEPEASAQEGGEGVGAEALTLTGQTSAEVLQQERDRVAAESEATRLAAQESAEKKAAEKKSLEDAIKARAANPDNFQFGEDAKAAAKPMGGLFDQPSANDQPANSKPSEMDALKAEMGQAIGELASILGAKQNLTPEEESRIIPVMSKIFRIAAKMGYIKFKDAANYVLGQIRTMAGKEIADKISIENLQAGYINVSKEIGGDKREAMSYDSIEDLEKANVIDERSSADLERDRRDTETQDSVGEDGLRAAWFKQALAAVPEGTAASDINEEIGAYAVEQYENGEQQPPVIRKWVGSLLSAIRTAIIRRMPAGKLKNWAIANITGQDMARLAVAGLRAKANRIEQAQGLGVNALNESDIVNLYGSRYSRASVKAKVDELTSQDAINTLIYNFQNKFIDLKNIKDRIIKMGGQVTDLNDAYLGEETYHSKVMKRGKDFLEGEMKQLLQQLHNNQIKKEDFEQFLHARHAPERNAEMAKRNPNQAMIDAGRTQADADVKALELQLQKATAQGLATKAIDAALTKARAEKTKWHGAQAFQGTEDERNSLSGMSDAAAAQVMASTPAGRRSTMDSAAAKVDAINAKTLDIQLASGLIDKATFDAIKKTYQFYVPLHRDEAHPDQNSHSIGQGFSVKGAGIQRATGSNEKVTNILGHIALQREAQNTRAEKNSVVKRLVLMAMQNPLKDFWAIDKPPMIKTIDQRTGFVRSSVDPMYKNKPNVVMARIAGKDIAIVFNERNPEAVRLAEALKNLDGQDLDVVERSIGRVTRWIASVNTQYNPIFGLINFARDVQGAMFNLTTTELKDHKAATWKETFRLFKEITKSGFQLDKMNAADQALWNDFQNSGGATGYRDMFANPEERTKALEKELKALDGGPVAQKFRATVQWLSDYNESMENVVRLAAYKVAVQNGMSKERAASLAKNLTVNFNRKGAKAQKLGAFYAFFNASIQGSTRLAKTLKGPAGRKIIAGGIALGVMQQMLGMMMMGGGDDDEWEKIPGFIKERSIVIPTSKDAYVAIPMPLGFNVIPNVGRLFAEWAMGGSDKPTGKQLAKLVGVIVSGFNPVGGTDLVDAVTPTAADPMIALLRNMDWTGKPIYREDMASLDPTPGFTRTKDSATPWAKGIAYAVNWASGGTDYQPGAVSWTPDQVDYIFGTVFGGAGRELGKLAQTLAAPFSAEELPMHKVPLFGRVVGSTAGVSGQSAKFYENIRTLNGFEQEIQGRNEKGEDVDQFLKSEPRAELVGLANAAERQVKQLRKTQKLLKDEGDNAGAKELDASITEVMKGLNVEMRQAAR